MKKTFLILIFLFCLSSFAGSNDSVSFFENHGIFYLLGWAFFPRIMFWFVSAITGGFWFWIGVLLFPRIMVAYWATYYYFDTNPILCIIAWVIALFGESKEKQVLHSSRKKLSP